MLLVLDTDDAMGDTWGLDGENMRLLIEHMVKKQSLKDRVTIDHFTADKVNAGAEFLITQLFYDTDYFLEFQDYLRGKHGVKVPIVPGVLPFLSTEQIKRFASLCGAKLSDSLRKRLEALAHDDESVRQLGVDVCTDLCRRLLDQGVPGIHLYCLNRAASSTEILRNLDLE